MTSPSAIKYVICLHSLYFSFFMYMDYNYIYKTLLKFDIVFFLQYDNVRMLNRYPALMNRHKTNIGLFAMACYFTLIKIRVI